MAKQSNSTLMRSCTALALTLMYPVMAFADAQPSYLMWSMPSSGISFPIYVYSAGKQVAYLYGPTQQAFVGPYDATTTSGDYQLYYQTGTAWYGCTIALSKGKVGSKTTCPGTVINRPASNSNVFTMGTGAIAWPASSAPANPQMTNYGNRTIIFENHTHYPAIQIGEVCTLSANPNNKQKCNTTQNLFQIPQDGRAVFKIDDAAQEGSSFPAGLISYGFTMTAYQTKKGDAQSWVETGGYGPGGQPYATKIEGTSLPATPKVSGGPQYPTGATNIDVSAVDGYNVSVRVYPANPTYCTYTVPPEGSNVLGAGFYSHASPLGQLKGATTALTQMCTSSSQLPSGGTGTAWNLKVLSAKGDFEGCMSPCSYATKTGSAQQNMFCCTGTYGTASSCDQPPGTLGANNSTYVTNLKPPVSNRVYRFAYDDAVGDHACPAETNFVVVFGDESAM